MASSCLTQPPGRIERAPAFTEIHPHSDRNPHLQLQRITGVSNDLQRSPLAAPSTPSISRYDAPGRPRAAIVMFHGGKPKSTNPVDGRSLSWRRSLVMQRAIAFRAHQLGVSVWLTKFGQAGWNAKAPSGPTPIPDARWTLDQLRADLGEIPVVLLGHSMGARTAVAVADDSLVAGVVALAPWFPPDEPVMALAGKHLVAAQGRRDRITSYVHTEAFLARVDRIAASTRLVDMGGLGHYLVRGASRWNDVALSHSFDVLGINHWTRAPVDP